MAKPLQFYPYKGISGSPLSGNYKSFCIDNSTAPQVARVNKKTENTPVVDVSKTFTIPKRFANNYCLDSTGQLWQFGKNDSGEWGEVYLGLYGQGEDMVYWCDYLIMCRRGGIETYKPSSGSYVDDWQTDSGDLMFVGSDNIVYIANNNVVRTIEQLTNFNPSSPSSYSYTDEALDLPSDEIITSIGEIGSYMAFGTKSGKIYLWDRYSQSFEYPARLPFAIATLIPYKGLLFAILENGDIYSTNGVGSSLVKRFPAYIMSDKSIRSIKVYPNAWRVEGSKLFFGIGATTGKSPLGIYSYDIEENVYSIEYIISSGEIGESGSIIFYCFSQYDYNYPFFWIGYRESGTYKIDKVSLTDNYTTASFESEMVFVGSNETKKALKKFVVYLQDKLKGGCSITLYYRESTDDSYKEIGSFNTEGITSFVIEKTILVSNLQIKAVMATNGTNNVDLALIVVE